MRTCLIFSVLFSQRWILAYLFFWGFFFTYALRVNLSVAIVCMTKTPIENNSLLLDSDNITVSHREECGSLDQEIRSNEVRLGIRISVLNRYKKHKSYEDRNFQFSVRVCRSVVSGAFDKQVSIQKNITEKD